MAKKCSCLQRRSISLSLASPRASILIIALWSISLLSMFSVMLSYGVRQRAALVKRLDEKDKLALILEAGTRKAFVELGNSSVNTYDSLVDAWNDNPAVFQGFAIGDGEIDVFYDYINDTSGSMERHYGLVDEERKINLNKIDRPVLERLFQIVLGFDETTSQELAASIIDWRDSDSALSIPLGSAEGEYYRDAAYPYDAKNYDIEVLDELLLVKGMTADALDRIRDYVTIYGDGRINANTAPRTVFLALGLESDIADDIISFRSGKDQVQGTSDDNVFEAVSDITPKMQQFSRLADSDLRGLNLIAERYFGVNSSNFMIRCGARLKNRKYTASSVCVMDRKGKIWYWRES
ncbi:MAG: hypothetical protein WC569_01580 [Candidatus Omnitrophota bacterium]